jgi:unsaturated pyranuronate lyase
MGAINTLATMSALRIWNDVTARVVHGERMSLAVVELPPDSIVPEYRHHNEQTGVLLRGSVTFTIGEEQRRLAPGDVWRILADVPHRVEAGPVGAVVVEAFAPRREDWDGLELAHGGRLTWPE